MRTTSYYGRNIGAIVVEKRKGTVSEVKIGPVYRFTASEQATGSGLLRHTTRTVLTGAEAKRVAAELSAYRIAAYQHNTPSWDAIGDYDTALFPYQDEQERNP